MPLPRTFSKLVSYFAVSKEGGKHKSNGDSQATPRGANEVVAQYEMVRNSGSPPPL